MAASVAEYRGEKDGQDRKPYSPPPRIAGREVVEAYKRGYHRGLDGEGEG